MESPAMRTKKVACGCLTSWLMSSMRSTRWSSAGEGKPAGTLTRAACTHTGAMDTGTGVM